MDFDVELSGGAPWGFRIQGGKEFHSPIKITFLKPGGKASKSQSLKIGDVVSQINTKETAAMTHTQAEQLIKRAGTSLTLNIHRKDPPKSVVPLPKPATPPKPATESPEKIEDGQQLESAAPTSRRRHSSASRETTVTVTEKEKDPDWYRSMFKNVHQAVPLEATPFSGEEKKRAPVKKKASVYEMEVEKINQYHTDRSRRPHRKSLTGRAQTSADILALGKSHESGAPIRQHDDFIVDTVFTPSPSGSNSSDPLSSCLEGVADKRAMFQHRGRRATVSGDWGVATRPVTRMISTPCMLTEETWKPHLFKKPLPVNTALVEVDSSVQKVPMEEKQSSEKINSCPPPIEEKQTVESSVAPSAEQTNEICGSVGSSPIVVAAPEAHQIQAPTGEVTAHIEVKKGAPQEPTLDAQIEESVLQAEVKIRESALLSGIQTEVGERTVVDAQTEVGERTVVDAQTEVGEPTLNASARIEVEEPILESSATVQQPETEGATLDIDIVEEPTVNTDADIEPKQSTIEAAAQKGPAINASEQIEMSEPTLEAEAHKNEIGHQELSIAAAHGFPLQNGAQIEAHQPTIDAERPINGNAVEVGEPTIEGNAQTISLETSRQNGTEITSASPEHPDNPSSSTDNKCRIIIRSPTQDHASSDSESEPETRYSDGEVDIDKLLSNKITPDSEGEEEPAQPVESEDEEPAQPVESEDEDDEVVLLKNKCKMGEEDQEIISLQSRIVPLAPEFV